MAWSLARTDPARALEVAETVELPGVRGPLLVGRRSTTGGRARTKARLLARAAAEAKDANLQYWWPMSRSGTTKLEKRTKPKHSTPKACS